MVFPVDTLSEVRDYLGYLENLGYDQIVIQKNPVETSKNSEEELAAVRAELGDCRRCRLSQGRHHLVFGEGSPVARLMFVGEGPGADEDREGRPFVGRAGQLLNRMIMAMGLDRSKVYIANVVKCRPPGNRDPESDEIDTCLPYLRAQIRAISPEVIVGLGRIAVSSLLGRKVSLTKIRGNFSYVNGIPIMPTYHPSFLLRKGLDRKWKAEAWEDLRKVMALLGLPFDVRGDSK
ncbi:MAG: uracil-DNA glycosylase [Desulfomonilaceae bacterium]